jgi:2-C-methyl-D-erythritol 4-phosphate cytidylyltransferase
VVTRFGAVTVAAVAGDEDNIKVTYPADLTRVIPLSATAGNGSH